ncbi:hypothetical protein Tco_0875347 [Tanacetum coccineum]|uniref:Uncharacterized protein n=1 Tax=Tanacetum coccineum TaxID=301880 RepID=A0ABQ5BP71_9ASTR
MVRFAMSSDNASSTITYTSVTSDSNGPSSWGIPLVNAGKILDIDTYEEAPSDDDIQVEDTDADSIDYLDELEDGEEDEDEDPEEDPSEEHDPKDDDDNDDTNDEDKEPT